MLKEEYNKYLGSFNGYVQSIRSDSPEGVSLTMVDLDGIKLRVGQIITDLDSEYNLLILQRPEGMTDKMADAFAKGRLEEKHGISKGHFEKLYKDLHSLVQTLKKRLAVLERDF